MVDKIGSASLPSVIRESGGTVPQRAQETADGLAFNQILQQQIAGSVRFSAHAQQRLAQASVQLGPQDMSRLEAAVDKAGQKGGKDSLILLDDLAFVVSVKNRTVITAVGADRMADNVFTKIDSVVIAQANQTQAQSNATDGTEPDPSGELAPRID
jgi:flagellar operon protein